MAGKRHNQRKLLWQEWIKYKEAKNAKSSNSEVQMVLKRTICKELARDMARFRSSGEKEDGLYLQITSLMDVYRGVLASKEKYDSFSTATKEILAVFEARLSLFDKDAAVFLSAGENPITKEKDVITEAAIQYVADMVDVELDLFLSGGGSAVSFGEVFDKLYRHYKEGIRIAFLSLGDIRLRKTARFFLGAFEKEMSILENLSQAKLSDLEAYEPAEPDERAVVAQVVKILRETPVFLVWFQNDYHSPEPSVDVCCDFAGFEKAIKDEISKVVAPPTANENLKEAFEESMNLETRAVIKEIRHSYMKGTYRLRQVIASDVLLTTEIVDAFSKTLSEMPELTPDGDASETERVITSGIVETIGIKIESLNDSLKEFRQRADGIVSSLAGEKEIFPDTMCDNAAALLIDAWMDTPPEKNSVDKFFETAKDGEAFAEIKSLADKKLAASMEKAEKNAFKYKKEVLLFEICTYEEILTHSVSRLRQSNSEAVIEAARVLDDAFRLLEVILKKNNIKMLRPAPHDQFNAKEHEVLVAEKHEGFTKGEIIKIVNAGYMHEDKIIIRANVIAAK